MLTLLSSAPPPLESSPSRSTLETESRSSMIQSTASVTSEATAADSGTCHPTPPPSKALSPPPTLKRSRSPSSSTTTMDSELVPAPHIDGDAMLEIFVHSSIRFNGMPMNPDSLYSDGPRLATLGSKMLEAAYMSILFHQHPLRKAEELEAAFRELPNRVEQWVEGYKWREKVRCAPDVNLRDPKETRLLMDAYVGAVFVGGGFQAVMTWIAALVDPSAKPPGQQAQAHYEPELKRSRVEPQVPPPFSPQHQYMPQQPYGMPPNMLPGVPPPPAIAPPPLPGPVGNPLAPAQPGSAFLPLFNQTAQQRRLDVQYPAKFSGPPHAGRWTVQCVVNGLEKGAGTGASKQLAKEEAARQAYYNMGWAPRV